MYRPSRLSLLIFQVRGPSWINLLVERSRLWEKKRIEWKKTLYSLLQYVNVERAGWPASTVRPPWTVGQRLACVGTGWGAAGAQFHQQSRQHPAVSLGNTPEHAEVRAGPVIQLEVKEEYLMFYMCFSSACDVMHFSVSHPLCVWWCCPAAEGTWWACASLKPASLWAAASDIEDSLHIPERMADTEVHKAKGFKKWHSYRRECVVTWMMWAKRGSLRRLFLISSRAWDCWLHSWDACSWNSSPAGPSN